MEHAVQTKPRIDVAGKLLGCRDDRFQRRANVAIAVRLTAGQGTTVTAQKGKMGG